MNSAEPISKNENASDLPVAAGRNWKWWLVAALICALLIPVVVRMDVPASRFLRSDTETGKSRLPREIHKIVTLGEVFGHGCGVGLILLTVVVLDPVRRRCLPRLLVLSYGAGLMANIGKLLVARVRPHHWNGDSTGWDTFVGWMPAKVRGELPFEVPSLSALQSFPSSHTATAMGLALGLAWLYPRGTWLFLFFTGLVATQRIETGAHWPSDTLAAIPIAILWAWLCSRGPLNRSLSRFEKLSGFRHST